MHLQFPPVPAQRARALGKPSEVFVVVTQGHEHCHLAKRSTIKLPEKRHVLVSSSQPKNSFGTLAPREGLSRYTRLIELTTTHTHHRWDPLPSTLTNTSHRVSSIKHWPLRGLDHHLLHGQGGAGLATMPPSSALLPTTTAGSTFGQPRLRGTSPFHFATKQTLLQFDDLGFEDLDLVLHLLLLSQSSRMQALVIMSLLAQLDVFQPKFFLNLSHWKARLPGDEEVLQRKVAVRAGQDETVVEGPFTDKPTQTIQRALFAKALATFGELSGGWL